MASLKKVKSAERTLDLLEVLADAPMPLNTSALAEALDIPKSSLFHLLGTLEDRGYIAPKKRGYVLGPKLGELAATLNTRSDITSLFRPLLNELSATINETCSLNIRKDDTVEVVATVAGRHALSYTMQLGDVAPLYAVSAGKAILAKCLDHEIEAYLERLTFEKFTPQTIHSPERLWRDIERSRSEGFGYVEEEFTPGIVGLAIALPQLPGDPSQAALNIAIPSARFDAQKLTQIRQELRILASKASGLAGQSSI
ncbi:IclR family transcriptional regulator [Roseibium limicola]|nr:IclR family transcriptional regulator [Roseibium limicola]